MRSTRIAAGIGAGIGGARAYICPLLLGRQGCLNRFFSVALCSWAWQPEPVLVSPFQAGQQQSTLNQTGRAGSSLARFRSSLARITVTRLLNEIVHVRLRSSSSYSKRKRGMTHAQAFRIRPLNVAGCFVQRLLRQGTFCSTPSIV